MKELVKRNQGRLTLGIEKEDKKVVILGIDRKFQNLVQEGEEWEFEFVKEVDLKRKDKHGNNLFLRLYKPIKRIEKVLFEKIENNQGFFKVISGNKEVKRLVIVPEIKKKVVVIDSGVVIYEDFSFKLPNGEEMLISKDRKFYSFEKYSPEDIPIKNDKILKAYEVFVEKKKEGEKKEKEKLALLKEISARFPKNLVLHFLKYSAKQLTESEIDYTAPLYGQEEELFESGNLRWKLEISMIDEDFVEWERAITNAGEIRDSEIIQKLQDMAMFAVLKNMNKKLSLPAFVEREIMKNIEKPAPISYYDVSIQKDIVTYDKFSPYGDSLPTGKDFISEEQEKEWKKEQEKIVKEKAEQAKKEVKPIVQENEYIKVTWKPEVKSGVGMETVDLEKGRGFATYLVAFVIVVWKAEVVFKVEIASDVKEVILQKFPLDI